MKCLERKNAIITGASMGIGAASAIAMAESGDNVAINCNGAEVAADRRWD
jgi:NAD(P)-dependent dehydrogenase (short-subunit alcohol dehydrogenase family)